MLKSLIVTPQYITNELRGMASDLSFSIIARSRRALWMKSVADFEVKQGRTLINIHLSQL
jgi:hypothetical protein